MPNQTQLNPGLQALIVAGIIVIFAVCYLLCWMWLNSPQRDIGHDREESLFLHKNGVSHNEDVKARLTQLKKRLAVQNEELARAKEIIQREVAKFNEGRSGKDV